MRNSSAKELHADKRRGSKEEKSKVEGSNSASMMSDQDVFKFTLNTVEKSTEAGGGSIVEGATTGASVLAAGAPEREALRGAAPTSRSAVVKRDDQGASDVTAGTPERGELQEAAPTSISAPIPAQMPPAGAVAPFAEHPDTPAEEAAQPE